MCETWVAAQPTLKIAADVLYETVSTTDEQEAKILHGKQPPKTEENEIATKIDPAPCHTLKCPNLSIYQASKQKSLLQKLKSFNKLEDKISDVEQSIHLSNSNSKNQNPP